MKKDKRALAVIDAPEPEGKQMPRIETCQDEPRRCGKCDKFKRRKSARTGLCLVLADAGFFTGLYPRGLCVFDTWIMQRDSAARGAANSRED